MNFSHSFVELTQKDIKYFINSYLHAPTYLRLFANQRNIYENEHQ